MAAMQTLAHMTCSKADLRFAERFAAAEISAAEFHHRDHVRLAYVLLCELAPEQAHERMRAALKKFLSHHQVNPAKYHETITRAWILAVARFMAQAAPATSADQFIADNPRLLDPDIMLSHYSRERLFSDDARQRFLAPDRAPIA